MADTKITNLAAQTAASGDEVPANRAGADAKLLVQDIAKLFPAAAQSDQETGTSTTVAVVPNVQQHHKSAAKCWGFTTGAGTPVLNAQSYNMTSITDTAAGILTITIATDFSSASYVAKIGDTSSAAGDLIFTAARTKAAGSVLGIGATAGGAADPGVGFDWVFYGDQ